MLYLLFVYWWFAVPTSAVLAFYLLSGWANERDALSGNDVAHEKTVETAFLYHDIGFWWDHVIEHLEPSEAPVVADIE